MQNITFYHKFVYIIICDNQGQVQTSSAIAYKLRIEVKFIKSTGKRAIQWQKIKRGLVQYARIHSLAFIILKYYKQNMRPSSSLTRNERRDALEDRKNNGKNTAEQPNWKKYSVQLQNFNQPSAFEYEHSFDVFAKNQYDRVVGLVEENRQEARGQALKILKSLCKSINRLNSENKFFLFLAENIVKGYWSLRNELIKRTEISNREGLSLIRHSVSFFEVLFQKNARTSSKNNLSCLYLIMANEQYHCQHYKQSLLSCEKSLRLCEGTKFQIQMHKIKVYFLKTNVYEAIGDSSNQLSAIKSCIEFIRLSQRLVAQPKEKSSLAKLKKNLIQRKKAIESQIKPTKPSQFNENSTHQVSVNKFRKRSLSLKKSQSQHELKFQKINEKSFRGYTPESSGLRLNLQLKKDKMSSMHVQLSSNNLKKVTINIENKRSVQDLKKELPKNAVLKKRPLKIQQIPKQFAQRTSKYERINVFEQIQHLKPQAINYEDLMVARPRAKREQQKESALEQLENKPNQSRRKKQTLGSQIQQQKKEISEQYSQKIEPITHIMNEEMVHQIQEDSKEQREALQNKVIWEHQENLLKQFLKKNFNPIDQQQLDEANASQSQQNYQQSIQNQQAYADQEIVKNSTLKSDGKPISQKSLLNGFQQQKYNLKNIEWKINQGTKLCTSFGYLSNFDLKTHVYSLLYDVQDEEQSLQRILVIRLKALLNQEEAVSLNLQYKFQSNENSIQQIMKAALKGLEYDTQYQSTTNLMFQLISNKIMRIKKAVGTVLLQKINREVSRSKKQYQKYTAYLKQRFTVYQLNKKTAKFLEIPSRKSIDLTEREINQENQELLYKKTNFSINLQSEQKQYDYYLALLLKKLTAELRDDQQNISSLKRIKTQFRKNTVISYKSTMKSIDLGDFSVLIKDDQSKTLSLAIMPTNFRTKISNYFQKSITEKKDQTPFEQFYYCMKFVLIKPFNTNECKFIQEFYEKIQVLYLHRLKNRLNCKIKMSCLKPKQIFKIDSQLFFKFQLEVLGLKTKMFKFIATSKDLKLFNMNVLKAGPERIARNSKKFLKKVNLVEDQTQYVEFKQDSLLNLLKKIVPSIFIKKDYIYNIVGLESEKTTFSYINKFKLQGKQIQNKHFMINHLKQINVLFQKSIKIKCECLKQFAILTIRKIHYSQEFNMYFYVPKLQKTFSLSLKQDIIKYLNKLEIFKVFKINHISQKQMKHKLFSQVQQTKLKSEQRQLWNNFVNIFIFGNHFMEDRMQISLKIGKYEAFLKDCSFSQYFQLNRFIYYMEMSLSKKGLAVSQEIQTHKKANSTSYKRKSSSSKELIKHSNKVLQKTAMKASAKNPKISIKQRQNQQLIQSLSFQKLQFLQKFNQIYQTDSNKYVLYITLSQIIEIKQRATEDQTQTVQPKKITYSFYLSNLCALIKQCKAELQTLGLTVKQENNQEIFSFALLQRVMTVIKYRIVKELKMQSEINADFINNLYKCQKIIQNQYLFKSKLNEVFNYQEQNNFSLNSTKKIHNFQKNNFLIYKNVMQLKKNELIAINFSQIKQQITFFLINNSELTSKHRKMKINQMKMPFLGFLKRQELCLMSNRIYEYYKNILLIL